LGVTSLRSVWEYTIPRDDVIKLAMFWLAAVRLKTLKIAITVVSNIFFI